MDVQQLREATPFDHAPKYLIHDNDATFNSRAVQEFLASSHIKSKKTSYHSPWQNCFCERLVGIIRQELLNHIIPFNQKHLEYLLREYVEHYYHPVRTHQGINCETPVLSNRPPQTTAADTVLVSEPILGGLYHKYRKTA